MDLTKWDPVVAQELVEALMAENKQLKADLRTAIDALRQYILEADRASKQA
jgi:hypothetical protein